MYFSEHSRCCAKQVKPQIMRKVYIRKTRSASGSGCAGQGIIKGSVARLGWKHTLSDIQNKNKTKQVVRRYYRLTGKHHRKQSPHGIQMETYPVTAWKPAQDSPFPRALAHQPAL